MNVRARLPRGTHARAAVLLLSLAITGCSERVPATGLTGATFSQDAGEAGKRTIKALGRVQPEGGIVSVTGAPGARIAKIRVEEGRTVTAGDELFRLDAYDVLDATCRSIRAQLEETEELLSVEGENTEQLKKELEIEDSQVQVIDPLDILAQTEKLNALEHKLKYEEGESKRLRSLRDASSPLVSAQQIEAQDLLVDGARAERSAAKAMLDKLNAGHALARRKLAVKRSEIAVASRRARLAAHKKSLMASLDTAERQRDQALIRAPRDGRILRVHMRDGETIGNQPVIQMGDTRAMCIIADVSDLYIRELRTAKRAKTTALGETLEGSIEPQDVGRIIGKSMLVSLDPTVDADRRVVEVKVRLDKPSSAKAADLTNLQVDVVISPDDSPAPGPSSKGASPDGTDPGGRTAR